MFTPSLARLCRMRLQFYIPDIETYICKKTQVTWSHGGKLEHKVPVGETGPRLQRPLCA